jgi:type IV pilus assembly protein PilM
MGKSLITGVDIHPNGVVAVTLQLDKRGYSLIGYQAWMTPADIVTDFHANKHQELVKRLKKLKRTLSLFHRKIAMVLDDSAVFSKSIELETTLSPYELTTRLHQDFAPHSPLPIDELYLDYVEPRRSGDERGGVYQVYAAKKRMVDQRTQLAAESGLRLAIIDIERQALIHLLLHSQQYMQGKHGFLIAVRHSTLSFCCIACHDEAFFKQIPLAVLRLSSKEQVAELSRKIKREFALFRADFPQTTIGGVWVMADHAETTRVLQQAVDDQHSFTCEVLQPLAMVDRSLVTATKSEQQAGVDQGVFGVAFGAALRGLAAIENGYAA